MDQAVSAFIVVKGGGIGCMRWVQDAVVAFYVLHTNQYGMHFLPFLCIL